MIQLRRQSMVDLIGMRRLAIFCEGGFGNRFNSLIVGLAFAGKYKYHPVIIWPRTHVCGALFEDLFDSAIESTDDTSFLSGRICGVAKHAHVAWFGTQRPWWETDKPIFNVHAPFTFDELNQFYIETGCDDCVYFNDSIPSNIIDDDLIDPLVQIPFRTYLREAADRFIDSVFGTNKFFGYHLRLTDFNEDEGTLIAEARRKIYALSGENVFVCSDSPLAERQLTDIGGVFSFGKNSYVEKLDSGQPWVWTADGGWVEYNVKRSAESVREAVVDLIILSNSIFLSDGRSSFFRTAERLQRLRVLSLAAAQAGGSRA